MSSPLVGTWFLVAQYSLSSDGARLNSRGENPAGILMYDNDGNMSVQLMRTDERAAEYTDLSDLRTAMEGYHAYFGRYEVDEAQKLVRHHVTGSAYPDYRGTTQIRYYELEGNTLTLRGEADTTRPARVMVWQRAGRAE
ncbi:MAG: lipocalin-like domain-containing protein [Chloroflexota bacterium]